MREKIESAAAVSVAAEGTRPAAQSCAALTPEVRTQLQICLTNVEVLAALDLPIEAQRCVLGVKRAVELLIDGLTGNASGKFADSRRLFR